VYISVLSSSEGNHFNQGDSQVGLGVIQAHRMNPDKFQFLSLLHLPGRFSVQEAGWYLGFSADDIPRLTKARLLKPVGKPGPKATKIYSLARLRRLRESDPWMNKASDTMYKFWQNRNRRLKKKRKA